MKSKTKTSHGVKWPATPKELYAAGYVRDIQRAARPCKRCGAKIEFWQTPTKSWMPIEVNPEDKNTRVCHFYTCPNAGDFRRDDQKPLPKQSSLFD